MRTPDRPGSSTPFITATLVLARLTVRAHSPTLFASTQRPGDMTVPIRISTCDSSSGGLSVSGDRMHRRACGTLLLSAESTRTSTHDAPTWAVCHRPWRTAAVWSRFSAEAHRHRPRVLGVWADRSIGRRPRLSNHGPCSTGNSSSERAGHLTRFSAQSRKSLAPWEL